MLPAERRELQRPLHAPVHHSEFGAFSARAQNMRSAAVLVLATVVAVVAQARVLQLPLKAHRSHTTGLGAMVPNANQVAQSGGCLWRSRSANHGQH